MYGTDVEFRRLCEVAAGHGGIVIDDIVPGHTGKGPDFRLAEMGVGDYPQCRVVKVRGRLSRGWTGRGCRC